MEAEIIEIINETKGVKTFVLEPEKEFNFVAGQYAIFVIRIDGKEHAHTFSISCSPNKKTISFTTIISESPFKQKLNQMFLGETIEVSKAMGSFTLEKSGEKPLVFLAGGIGITPVKSILEYIAEKKKDRDITLLYSNKTIDRVVFKEKLDEIEKKINGLKLVYVLSEEEKVPLSFEKGRITKEIIEKYVSELGDSVFYVVGPPAFVEAMKATLNKEMFILEENIITENFNGY
jgi:ferredoxin-NADP reductase